MTRPGLCVLALLAVLAEGCGEDAARERAPAPAPAPAPRAITDADNGKSFTLAQGSETSLRLSGGYEWGEPAVRGDAVELARVDYLRDPGFSEWTVLGVRPGTATIAARGTPAAGNAPLNFQVRIVVPR